MPLTNAEKQKRHRDRIKIVVHRLRELENATLSEAVTLLGGIAQANDDDLERLRVAVENEQAARGGPRSSPPGTGKYAGNPRYGQF